MIVEARRRQKKGHVQYNIVHDRLMTSQFIGADRMIEKKGGSSIIKEASLISMHQLELCTFQLAQSTNSFQFATDAIPTPVIHYFSTLSTLLDASRRLATLGDDSICKKTLTLVQQHASITTNKIQPNFIFVSPFSPFAKPAWNPKTSRNPVFNCVPPYKKSVQVCTSVYKCVLPFYNVTAPTECIGHSVLCTHKRTENRRQVKGARPAAAANPSTRQPRGTNK